VLIQTIDDPQLVAKLVAHLPGNLLLSTSDVNQSVKLNVNPLKRRLRLVRH
jgi:hypothetical protein